MISRRQLLAALLGLAAAAACVKAGFWQVDRLRRRQELNTVKLLRLNEPPTVPWLLLQGTRQYRRVTLTGTFDFDHQIVLTNRSLDGAPGVNVITPFLADGKPWHILVDRGWVYAPDAQTVDVNKHDEPPHQTFTGYVEEFAYVDYGPPRAASNPNAWRYMDSRELKNSFPYQIVNHYIVAQADSGVAPAPNAPVRLPLPSLDEGPHRGYAIQWFAFALIALGGASIVIYKERQAAGTGKS